MTVSSRWRALSRLGFARSRMLVIISQTCDVIQETRQYVSVAPVYEATEADWTEIAAGKRPLKLAVEFDGLARPVADLERLLSMPKRELLGATLMGRIASDDSSLEARTFAARLGRAFSRFGLPPEVEPVFSRLHSKVRDKANKQGNLGQVLGMVLDFRIKATHWVGPNRKLSLYIIVQEELLIPDDERDPSWQWTPSRVRTLKADEKQSALSLDRVCQLILSNKGHDSTTLLELWRLLGEVFARELVTAPVGVEVDRCDVLVLSELEFTYADWRNSESLNLNSLSSSVVPD